MKKITSVALVTAIFIVACGPFAQAATDSLGVNVVTSGGTVYTITTENGQTVRRPYTSAGAFLSYGFNSWSNIKIASGNELSLPEGSFIPPQDGKVFCSDRGTDKGTCYLITKGQKAGFVSEQVFKALGYSFDNVAYGDVSFMSSAPNINDAALQHTPGSLISFQGTVFVVCPFGLSGLPSLEVLKSWGYAAEDIVPANGADMALPKVNTLTEKPAIALSPILYCDPVTTPPTPTPTPPAPTPVPSDIVVYAPAGGEIWMKGSTYSVKWSAPSSTVNVNIALVPVNNCGPFACSAFIAPKVVAENISNDGEYQWTIPNDCNTSSTSSVCSSNFEIQNGDYYIHISDSTNSSHYGLSPKPFTIISQSSAVSQY